MKNFFYISFIILFSTSTVFGQEIPPEITDAFHKGKADQLAAFFNDNLELKIHSNTYVTSSEQAERIIDKFFKDHPPKSFIVNFDGTAQGSKYGLGSLITEDNSFRVNIYFLDQVAKKKIYFLSIEKEN